MEKEEDVSRVARMVLQRLEEYLGSCGPIDPQKCKHVTAALKDIRDLQQGQEGAAQLVVVFDPAAEAAAQ